MIISEAFYLMGHPLFLYTRDDLLSGHTLFVISPWLLFCILSVIISAILIAFSIRFVKPVRYRYRTVYDYEPGDRAQAEDRAAPAES